MKGREGASVTGKVSVCREGKVQCDGKVYV